MKNNQDHNEPIILPSKKHIPGNGQCVDENNSVLRLKHESWLNTKWNSSLAHRNKVHIYSLHDRPIAPIHFQRRPKIRLIDTKQRKQKA